MLMHHAGNEVKRPDFTAAISSDDGAETQTVWRCAKLQIWVDCWESNKVQFQNARPV